MYFHNFIDSWIYSNKREMFPRNDVGINETPCTFSTMLHARWIKEKSPSGILTSALLFIEIATKGCGSEKFHAVYLPCLERNFWRKEIARISNTVEVIRTIIRMENNYTALNGTESKVSIFISAPVFEHRSYVLIASAHH